MGAAGDMLMSALYELLEDQKGFLEKMNSLGLPGVNLKAERGKTCGIAGTHMKVTVYGEEETEPSAGCGHSHEHEHGHRHGHDHEHSREHDHEHSHEHAHIHDHTHAHTHAHGHGHHHATPGHIGALIDGLNLPDEVKCHAKAVYDAIAQAEAHAHGCWEMCTSTRWEPWMRWRM